MNIQPKPAKSIDQAPGVTKPDTVEEDILRKESKPSATKTNESRKTPFNLMAAILGIIISSLIYFTIQYHHRVTRPLESGSVLLPGQWKSPCGLYDLLPQKLRSRLPIDFLPPACESSSSSSLEFGSDGTLRYFKEGSGGERKVVRSVAGSIGSGDQCSQGTDEQCTENGALFVKDGYNWYLVMGEKRVTLSWDVMRDFTS